MPEVSVEVNGGPCLSYLEGEGQRIAEVTAEFLERSSQAAVEQMRLFVPLKSGFLRESISRRVDSSGMVVWAAAKYAGFVDQGTGPHTIFPSSGRVLAFTGPNGATIFARHVHHPGTKAQNFVKRTAEAIQERLTDIFEAVWREKH